MWLAHTIGQIPLFIYNPLDYEYRPGNISALTFPIMLVKHKCTRSCHPWKFNSMKSNDTTWRHAIWWILVEVKVCCFASPTYCLNLCWLRSIILTWTQRKMPTSSISQFLQPLTHLLLNKMVAILLITFPMHLNEKFCIWIQIPLKFVLKGSVHTKTVLV